MRWTWVVVVGMVVLGIVWFAAAPPALEAREPAARVWTSIPRAEPARSQPGARAVELRQPRAVEPASTRAPAPETPPVVEPDPEVERAARESVVAGDAAMDAGDLAAATLRFRRVVEETPDSKMAPYAAYKLGWCAWNADDRDQAFTEMARALEWAEGQGDTAIVEAARSAMSTWASEAVTTIK